MIQECEVRNAKPSVLAALANARVMTLEKIEDGRFVITEGADGYFELELSRSELLSLAEELRSIANAADCAAPPSSVD